ncbi:hypothetical protein ACU639_27105 [Streptomyces cynarae]|uniref:hypothetical protein n=1 Tax=Streptomyces cynarae TaxID=2981134 RepID=UPI00406D3F7C
MRLRKRPATTKAAGPSLSPAPLPLTDKLLLALALTAGIAVTAYSEWQLALQVGIHPLLAPLFPVAVDTYVVASVRAGQGRDIAASLAVMGGCQVSAHLLTTHSVIASIPLVATVSLLIPVTVWRVHALAGARTKPTISTGATTVAPNMMESAVDVTRVGAAPWKPATPKWSLALQPPAAKAVRAALTPVSLEPGETPEGPQKPSADQVVRGLYDELGGRPATRHIVEALEAEGLPHSEGTAREARKRVEAKEPKLKTLPTA